MTSHTPGFRWLLRCVALLLLLFGLPSGCSQDIPSSDFSGRTPIVRVLLLQNQTALTVTASAEPMVQVGNESQPKQLDLPAGVPVSLLLSGGGWQLGGVPMGAGDLLLLPAADGSVTVNGKAYRGRYRFIATSTPGAFDVINEVDLESYLKGVIAREMPVKFLPEAYRAQAVVARTYALYQTRVRRSNSMFDLFCDERDQVYGGISGETPMARSAVDSTRGMVAVFGPVGSEKIFKAYFSACCGGVGQSAADAFGDLPTVPLQAQKFGNLCDESPRFSWPPVIVSKTELTRRIRLYGQHHDRPERAMGPLVSIDITGLNALGRPVRFTATDAHGRHFFFTGEEIRQAVNTDYLSSPTKTRLLSSLFQVQNTPTEVHFVNGHGLGHGVGMCQWCAQRRAELGQTYDTIVTASFPDSKLMTIY